MKAVAPAVPSWSHLAGLLRPPAWLARIRGARIAMVAVGALGSLMAAGCGDGRTSAPAVASVAVRPPGATLEPGESLQFEAEVRDAGGHAVHVPVEWTTSNPAVFSVTPAGLAVGVSPGSAHLTATAGGLSAVVDVTVRDPSPPPVPTGLRATPVSDVEMEVTWEDGSERETEFRVEREEGGAGAAGPAGAGFVVVGTVGPDVTVFRDEGLSPGAAYRYRVAACNENGCSSPSAPTSEVRTHPRLVIETSALPPALLGTPYEAVLEASGPEGGVVWGVVDGELPPGVAVSGEGVLAGEPGAEGDFAFTVRAEGAGQVRTRGLTLHVEGVRIVTQALPDGHTGSAYAVTLEAEGGVGEAVWSVVDGAPPPGLELSSDGILAGTPTASGVFTFTVDVTRGGSGATTPFTLVVDRLSVATAGLPAAGVDVPYAAQLDAAGGDGTFTWSVVGGSLPPGLVLDGGTGALTGAPERAGGFGFTVAAKSGDGQEAAAGLELVVEASPVSITTSSLLLGSVGAPYSRLLQSEGGDGTTYAWSVEAGALPPGLELHPATGLLSGIPTAAGTFDFTVAVESGGFTDARGYSLLITVPPVVVESRHLRGAYRDVAYQETVEVSGGDGSYAFSVVGGELPPGLTLDPATGTLAGAPEAAGLFYVTVRAESAGNVDARTLLLAVSAAPPGAFNVHAATVAGSTVPSAAAVEALGAALARWEEVIVSDLPDITYGDDVWSDQCGGHASKLNGAMVDDLVVLIDIRTLDGEGGLLGAAGPCAVRSGGPPWLTVFGILILDAADLAAMDADAAVSLGVHEIGHVVGLGTLWSFDGNALLTGAGTSDPRYVGAEGVAQYQSAYGGTEPDVAVANTGGSGTRDAHWREGVFDTELMTGYAESQGTPQPLSRISIGSVADLGYAVDLGAADPYALPGCSPGCVPPPGPSGAPTPEERAFDRVLDEPVWVAPPPPSRARPLAPSRAPAPPFLRAPRAPGGGRPVPR